MEAHSQFGNAFFVFEIYLLNCSLSKHYKMLFEYYRGK